MNTMKLSTDSGTLSIEWDGDAVSSVTLWSGYTMTTSYIDDGKIMFSPADAPDGCIFPLDHKGVEEYALMGGRLSMFAEDLFSMNVTPDWWGVECDMALEGECPEWPLAEDDIAGENTDLGFNLVGMILDHFNKPESQGNWDDEEEEDEGPDFV
jgi:hypothetical protein